MASRFWGLGQKNSMLKTRDFYCRSRQISGLSSPVSSPGISNSSSPNISACLLTRGATVFGSRSVAVLLPVCLACAIVFAACGLTSTTRVSDSSPSRRTEFPEPKILVDEERIEPPEHKSIPDQSLRAEADSAGPKGIYHKLKDGETLYALSRFYQVPLDKLMRANRISDPTRIEAGTLIFIPRSAAPVRPQARGIRALSWPLRGRITANFGPRGERSRHDGIDIDGERGNEVRAAAAGTVILAGTRGNYGQMVLIDHGDGLATLYAHVGKLLVRVGNRIELGEPIAEVGRSGNATGTHLHFEVHRNGQPVDPIRYLENGSVQTVSPAESLPKTGHADPASELGQRPLEPVIYEMIRSTSVLAEPSPFSQKVATISQGTKVRVVGSAGEWLEIRSRHGRPPGFIHRGDAMLPRTSG